MTRPQPIELDSPLLARYRERFDDVNPTGAPLSLAESKELFDALLKLNRRLVRIARISDNYQGEVKRLVLELQEALASVKTLRGLIPICASCKKIRTDEGYWKQLEQYVCEHSEALFSHGLCPECANNYFPLPSLDSPEQASTPAAEIEPHELSAWADDAILDALAVINNKHFAGAPLYPEFNRLLQSYIRLAKRLKVGPEKNGNESDNASPSQPPEAASRNGDARFQMLFAAAPLPSAIISNHGTIDFLNDQFTRLFGYRCEDINPVPDWLRLAGPEAACAQQAFAAWAASVQQAAAEGQSLAPTPCRVICKNGETCDQELLGAMAGDDLLVIFRETNKRNS